MHLTVRISINPLVAFEGGCIAHMIVVNIALLMKTLVWFDLIVSIVYC